MNNRPLLSALVEKIKYYQEKDNPEPTYKNKSTLAQVTTFFSSTFTQRGELGRKRARRYLAFVQTSQNDSELLQAVLVDVDKDNTERLGDSQLLRQRLLEGLCNYLDIKQMAIDTRFQQVGQRYVTPTYSAYPSGVDILKIALRELVKEKLQQTRPRVVPGENAVEMATFRVK